MRKALLLRSRAAPGRSPEDLAKLGFEVWVMDGDEVIASVSYEGEDLEIFADSSTGKAFYAYMGKLL